MTATVSPPPSRDQVSGDPALVFDIGVEENSGRYGESSKVESGRSGNQSARATMLRNRATLVVEGTLISAALESALDSTRPGPARALVTHDVVGFDGTRVLIPRGSRLVGEYEAGLQRGQNRALVIWTRLIRPDGAVIALGSPAVDPLGRVGVKGSVNSHFLERFGAALLQTSLKIGTAYAARGLGGNSIAVLTLPGGSGTTTAAQGGGVQPTLHVKQGASISVFVARDLDFTSVEHRK